VRDERSFGMAVIPTRSHFAFRQARQSFRFDLVIFGNGTSQECLISIRGSKQTIERNSLICIRIKFKYPKRSQNQTNKNQLPLVTRR